MPAPDTSPLSDLPVLEDLTVQVLGDDVGVVTAVPAGVYVKHPDGWRLAR